MISRPRLNHHNGRTSSLNTAFDPQRPSSNLEYQE